MRKEKIAKSLQQLNRFSKTMKNLSRKKFIAIYNINGAKKVLDDLLQKFANRISRLGKKGTELP